MTRNYQLAGYELKTPVIAAAGLINGPESGGLLRDVASLAETEIGAITVGSWTLQRRLGSAALYGQPTHYYDRPAGEMTNALGLPNVGLDQGQRLVGPIKAEADSKPIIFSVSPTLPDNEIGDPVDQSKQLVGRLFGAGADLVELNLSCPNIIDSSGDRQAVMGCDPQTMARLADELEAEPDAGHYRQRLGLKLPPYVSPEQRRAQKQIAQTVTQGPFAFLVASNTIPNHRPVDNQGRPRLAVPGGCGGLSGPATSQEGRRQLQLWQPGRLGQDLVGSLGVFDGHEVAARLRMGARAAAINTRLWQSSNWKRTMTEILIELSQHLDD